MKGNLFWLLVLRNTITPIYYKRRVIWDKDNWAAFYLLVVHCFLCVCVFFFFQDDPFTYRQLSTRLYLSHLETESQEDIQEETEVSQDADRGDILCHLFSKRLAPHSLLPEPSRDNIKQRKDRSEVCGCRRQVRVEIKHLQLLSGWIESYRAKQ